MRNAGTKIMVAIQAIGAVLLVVALAAFVLAGSQSITGLLYPAIGGAMGSIFAFILTRSRSSGRRVAGCLLCACTLGVCAFMAVALWNQDLANRFLVENMETVAFVAAFATGFFMTALFRLFGFANRLPESQSSRRRS